MKEQDEKPYLVVRIADNEPTNALKIAIRQTTQQFNGNKEVLLALKEHIEVLEWFDRKKAEWKTLGSLVARENLDYCLASSFELYRVSVVRSTLENESVKRR